MSATEENDKPQAEEPSVLRGEGDVSLTVDADDLAVIEATNDSKIDEGDNFAVFEQNNEGFIAWSIQNFYNEDGSIRSKRELKRDPAILRIEDNNEGLVDFMLTQEFTKSIAEQLETVHLATYGIQKSRKPLSSFKESFIAAAIEHPIRTVFLGALVVAFPLVFIFS